MAIDNGQIQWSKIGEQYNYLTFDGNSITDYIDLQNNVDVTALNTITVIAKVRYTTTTAADGYTIFQSGSNAGYFQFRIQASDKKLQILRSGQALLEHGDTGVTIDEWATVAVTYNATTGVTIFYLNGAADGGGTSASSFGTTNAGLLGGQAIGVTDEAFTGDIAYVKIYDKILSAAEIAQDAKGQEISDSLIHDWDFSEGSGAVLEDKAGSYDGSIHGAVWGEIDTGATALADPVFDSYKLSIANGDLSWADDTSGTEDEVILQDLSSTEKWELKFENGEFIWEEYDIATTERFSIQIRDSDFTLVKVLNHKATKVAWEYDRVGGCGACKLTIADDFDSLDNYINPDYDLQITIPVGGVSTLVYRGFAETYKPVIAVNDVVSLKFSGYSSQLKRIRINETYTNMDVNDIVKDIIQQVDDETSILYVENNVSGTPYIVSEIEFDTMADDALQTLAGLAGNIEWGVNSSREFFFLTLDKTVKHYGKVSVDIQKYDVINDYSQIINKLVVKGKDEVEYVVDNIESQSLYGIRTEVTSNSAITGTGVANQYGTNILLLKAAINQRAKVTMVGITSIYEATIPIGRMSILELSIPQAKQYNDADAIYGTFFYGGLASYNIERIKYQLQNKSINVSIDLGQARPDIAAEIRRLNFELSQIRNT